MPSVHRLAARPVGGGKPPPDGPPADGDRHTAPPVGVEPDRQRQDDRRDERQRHDPEDAVGVEPEVVTDLGQQHAEGGAVELVDHVEPEQHAQWVQRRPAGGPLRPARPPATGRRHRVGPRRRYGAVTTRSVDRHAVVRIHDCSSAGALSSVPPAWWPPSPTSACSASSPAASSTSSGGGSSAAAASSTRTSASRLGTTSPRRAAMRRSPPSRTSASTPPRPLGNISSTASSPTPVARNCHSLGRKKSTLCT